MNTPKILMFVRSCRECSNRQGHDCSLVNAQISDMNQIAPFCPLTDYPSRTIASQEVTINFLREPHKWGMALAVLTHVAAKLKLTLNADRVISITIPYRRGGKDYEACLMSDCITHIDLPGFGIDFLDRGQKFRLYADSTPPQLSFQPEENSQLWEQVSLVT